MYQIIVLDVLFFCLLDKIFPPTCLIRNYTLINLNNAAYMIIRAIYIRYFLPVYTKLPSQLLDFLEKYLPTVYTIIRTSKFINFLNFFLSIRVFGHHDYWDHWCTYQLFIQTKNMKTNKNLVKLSMWIFLNFFFSFYLERRLIGDTLERKINLVRNGFR